MIVWYFLGYKKQLSESHFGPFPRKVHRRGGLFRDNVVICIIFQYNRWIRGVFQHNHRFLNSVIQDNHKIEARVEKEAKR